MIHAGSCRMRVLHIMLHSENLTQTYFLTKEDKTLFVGILDIYHFTSKK